MLVDRLRWLTTAFHPSEVKLELRAGARAFHRLLYGVAPGDVELGFLLEGATGQCRSTISIPRVHPMEDCVRTWHIASFRCAGRSPTPRLLPGAKVTFPWHAAALEC
jgi:hypothetical protein